jgi:hypothetical protein
MRSWKAATRTGATCPGTTDGNERAGEEEWENGGGEAECAPDGAVRCVLSELYSQKGDVRIAEDGAIQWTEEVELCPGAAYLKRTGEPPEDILSESETAIPA